MVEHMEDMRDRMVTLWHLVREHMLKAEGGPSEGVQQRGTTERLPARRQSVGVGTHLRMYFFGPMESAI